MVGDGVCTSAMLSKFALFVSGGRKDPASITRPSRSSTDAAYSALLSRWKGREPGFGAASAASSMMVSRVSTSAVSVSLPGCGAPGGGIIPALSLAMIFSATSGVCGASRTSNSARERFPGFCSSL